MKLKSQVICTGIKESKGEFEGRPFNSTTFHLIVDVAESSSGRSIGAVTRPFKFGDASEFENWAHLKNSWPSGGVMCECEFDVVAGADNSSKLALLSIQPVQRQAQPKAA